MRTIIAAAVVLAVPFAAAAETYNDTATSRWFKTLSSAYVPSCCDQADCHTAKSEYRGGAWWALSNRTGAWVRIVDVQLTATVSIFKDGVLCEGDPIDVVGGRLAKVFCFAPPPLGF
jgi:hypothetical protein